MKTELTQLLEKAIWRETSNQGTFGCFEVTIGWYGKERVDYMTYSTKGEFRCYEVKVTKADFRSANCNTFVGHFNYYVMPYELYEQVQTEVQKHIGVYVSANDGHSVYLAKRAKRCELGVVEDVLKDSIIRSLCRDTTKLIQNDDTLVLTKLKREISRLKRERDNYYNRYWDLRRMHEEDRAFMKGDKFDIE